MKHKKKDNKRGVSPLIASVLLIAFTVAIGAIIMTWGRGFVTSQTEKVNTESVGSTACSTSVDVDFVKVGGLDDVCYTPNGYVNFTLQNTGTEPIYQLRVQSLDSSSNNYNNITTNAHISTTLESGDAIHLAFRLGTALTGVRQISIVPVIKPTGLTVNKTCSNVILSASNLRVC
ncbi:MAG: archaellin/type IV pilin N-terminal domain-containing protein [archaeon]